MNKSNLPLYEVLKIRDLKQMFNDVTNIFAERTAFLTKPKRGEPYVPISYRQYGEDIQALGTALLSKFHLGKGTATAILGESRYEWYVAYPAIVNGASVVVPLDKELPARELANLLLRSRANAIFVSDSCLPKLWDALLILREEGKRDQIHLRTILSMDGAPSLPEEEQHELRGHSFQEVLHMGRAALAEGERSFLDHKIDPEEMRILLFTSGTTSTSKAVMLNHKAIATNLMAMSSMVMVYPDDIFYSVLPLHHTYECTCGFLCPIYRGASIAQCEGLRYIPANLKESGATIMLVVPLIAETFYKRIRKGITTDYRTERKVKLALKLSSALRRVGVDKRRSFFKPILDQFGGALRLLIIGGAKVKPEIIDSLNSFGLLTIQGYGLTECAPIIALNRDVYHRSAAAGLPMPGVEIRVHEPGEDGIGEFIARGDNIMLGYYESPEETRQAIDEEGFFHTGDMGYIDEEGFVIITGRKKNVIVTDNGKKIFPEEIEFLLCDHPLVAEAIVSSDIGAKGEVQVVAEIFPDFEVAKTELGVKGQPELEAIRPLVEAVVSEVNHALPTYKMIRKTNLRATEFEKNTSKKIKRNYGEKK